MILPIALFLAQGMLAFALLFACIRMMRGPRAQDRVLALDTAYVVSMLLLMTLGIQTGTVFFFEASLVIAILGFVATVALAKFLMRGEVIE
ncbi:K+/H+ antiporter subunit F [Falsirhodobacter halotolerans]|uniref:K+/H+ antiporter subunit F n=1 Tax=Falsirhodobacter halotolerans TaxID=1146892 RepID=UPI001FD479E1|nr:K+/H+ antiporter subunit F [Falsirhodobacter halotolerans]MCJ8139205.1 K+/H+ antiporter subunit F [Falsirhodobacter halotolerans]